MKAKWVCEAVTDQEYPPSETMQHQVGAAWAKTMRDVLGPETTIRMKVDILDGPVPQVLGLPQIEDASTIDWTNTVRRWATEGVKE